MLEVKLLGCGIHVSPHIESRVMKLKKKYSALCEMLVQNGFGWHDEQMMLVCDRRVYDEWVKVNLHISYSLFLLLFPELLIICSMICFYCRKERRQVDCIGGHFHSTIYLVRYMENAVPLVQMLAMLMTMKRKLDERMQTLIKL